MTTATRSKSKAKVKLAAYQWYGGKWELAEWIISHFPEHWAYVEPFGGAASVLMKKEQSKVEVYNDLDWFVSNFFYALRHDRHELIEAISLTPYHRGEFIEAAKKITTEWDDMRKARMRSDRVEMARLFYQVARQSVANAYGKAWSHSIRHSRGGRASGVNRWLNSCQALYAVAGRISDVQIDCRPALEVLEGYDKHDALFYCDPPYHPDTCKSDVYSEKMTAKDHEDLVDVLMRIEGQVVLSGYAHPCYDDWLTESNGWTRVEREVKCRSNVKTTGGIASRPKRTEVLWIKANKLEGHEAN